MNNRREFIKILGLGGLATVVLPELLLDRTYSASFPSPTLADAWTQVPAILKRIKPPVFAKRDFELTKYGAVKDGTTDCTEAFRLAISACNKAGGGRVLVPAGTFLTGGHAGELPSQVDFGGYCVSADGAKSLSLGVIGNSCSHFSLSN